jgi:hypothetical protein
MADDRGPPLAALAVCESVVLDGSPSYRGAGAVGSTPPRSEGSDNAGVAKREPIDVEALRRSAQNAVLSGLARGDDVFDIMVAVAPADVPHPFAPDVVVLKLAVTALDLACAARAGPLEYEGLRQRYLPEVTFRGRVENRNSQYALYAAACMRGGLEPDLLHDAGWWQTPLWQYAVYAVVLYSRAAAERLAVPVEEVARRIAARHDIDLDAIERPR